MKGGTKRRRALFDAGVPEGYSPRPGTKGDLPQVKTLPKLGNSLPSHRLGSIPRAEL